MPRIKDASVVIFMGVSGGVWEKDCAETFG